MLEPEPEPQADSVEALFAEFAREDAAKAAAKHVGTVDDDGDDAIIGFIADSIVAFDDELEALRQGGPGALREHALQEALSDCQKNDRKLRLQELRLRRFCEQAGSSLDAPDKQLAECLGMLEQRRQQQQAKLRENEALEYKLLLSRREAELAEALKRAEAAELALQVERESQSRAKIAATTAVENQQSLRAASVGADAYANIAPSVDHRAALPPACGQEDKSPRAIVERLRMEKLVGGSSDPAIKSLQVTLGRALEKLSRDLYSSSEHFFSEVVQNCDDNDYPEGVIPTLRVVHTPSAISIANNEIGFSAADVAGLCNIGAGTKARDSVERVRIGRKGIGFKSVFMVTESPHICSAGFCWRFDTAAHGLFGYIVPEWVDRETLRAQLPESFDLPESDRHGTVIWLPLKADEPGGNFMDVAVQVEPPALLFLRRLRDIQLEDRRGPLSVTTRLSVEILSDSSSQLSVEAQRLCAGASDQRISVKRLRQTINGSEHETLDYILFTERLEIPVVVANQETDHCAGDVTQLVLAFPLVDEPDPQSIFAFLPVCPSNFPFVICADWSLTSSRQSVHSDSALNLWLRDHIAIVFGQAVACVPKIRENVGRYLPVEDMNSGVFWAPVATQLRTVLKDQACIFTEGGSWRKPQDVLLRVAECPPDLISNECLYTCCGKEFISESQLKSLGCEKAAELGCRNFEFSDLTLCFQRTEFVDQLHEAPDSYFERLYRYLHAVVGLDGSDDLFALPIFRIHEPSEDGETLGSVLACLADGKIFLSIPEAWHNVLYTRAVRVMCNAPSSVAAQQFCRSVDVLPATLVGVLDSIQDQHLAAAFNNRREVWSGLQFLKDFSHKLDASESEIRRLQLSLCAPAYCGALMSVSDLSVPCFMGVSCSICFPDQAPSVPSELKPKLLPVHIIPPISANSLKVTTQIKQGSGAASIVTHLSSRDKHKSFDQAAIASEGTSRGKIRYDVTVLAEGVGVGFAAASTCAESDSYLLNPSPRQGSVVMFGDGMAWLGSERAQGSQRFGPGDIVTVATDAKEGLIFLAVNGVLVDGPQVVHNSPSMPGRAHGAGLQVPREMIGGKLLPMIVLHGAECEVSFAADLHIQNLSDFVPLADYQTSNIRSRCSNEELSIDLSHVPSNLEILTAEKRLGWEAFFLSMGAAPHLATCSEPSFWNGHDGKCAICLSAFMPSDPAVEVASCQHRFHGSCIQEWLSRKQNCPVCRGPAKPGELQQPALRKGPVELSRSLEETLGRVTLMTPASPGRKLLLQALGTYSSLSLTADILGSTSVSTTHGLTSLDEVFVDSTYSRFAGPHLPYLSVSRAIPPDLASVLAALGVASVLDTRGVLKAIVLLGQLCRTNEGPEENGRLDLFAGLYGVLDGILRDESGRDARIAAVRKCFRESAIIFAQSSVLCRSDEALWDANYEIAAWLRRPVIGHLYPSLRLFFEEVLQVKSLEIEHCIFALRCMSRHEFRIAQLGNCSLLAAARVALAEVDKLLLHARDQGVEEHGGLDTCLANFPVLSDGTQLTDYAQAPNYAIRCCEDCICLVRDGLVASDFPQCFNQHACVCLPRLTPRLTPFAH